MQGQVRVRRPGVRLALLGPRRPLRDPAGPGALRGWPRSAPRRPRRPPTERQDVQGRFKRASET
eukprot:5374921-Pyramimonas_sp.AAC.1